MHSLLFVPELAQMVHDGRKHETRRSLSRLPPDRYLGLQDQVVYVRERFRLKARYNTVSPKDAIESAERQHSGEIDVWWHAQGEVPPSGERWGRGRPGIHLPQQLARTRCVVVDVRIEPLHLVDHAAAKREGFEDRHDFAEAWKRLYGASSWLDNPDVAVIRFAKLPR